MLREPKPPKTPAKPALAGSKAGSSRPGRDATGRILPGYSGNPAGKARYSDNRKEVMKALYRHGPEVVEKLMEWVRAGDKKIALFLADKLFPSPAPMEVKDEPAQEQGRGWTVAELRARKERLN